MSEQVTKWRTKHGMLADSPEAAAKLEADIDILKALHRLLDDGGSALIRFAGTGDCAEWILRHRVELMEILR
jgi:hypothetical protein